MEKSNFEIIDQILYYQNPTFPDVWRIAVPDNLRPIILKENHGGDLPDTLPKESCMLHFVLAIGGLA